MEKLKAMGIGTGLHFRAAHTQKYYRERFPEVSPAEYRMEQRPHLLSPVVPGYDR
ncbi:hypothetical protein KPZU40_13910 [Klebsiella pneumoniae]|nr:hypothetical protein KPZU40_13910 [Klebsiella pneumoniae]